MPKDNELPEIDMAELEKDPLFAAIKEISSISQSKVEALFTAGLLTADSDLGPLSHEILDELSPKHLAALLCEAENLPPED